LRPPRGVPHRGERHGRLHQPAPARRDGGIAPRRAGGYVTTTFRKRSKRAHGLVSSTRARLYWYRVLPLDCVESPRAFRFGLPASIPPGSGAIETRAGLVGGLVPLDVEPVTLPSYPALFDAVDQGACDAAWCPPLIALDLHACDAARPVAALGRVGGTSY